MKKFLRKIFKSDKARSFWNKFKKGAAFFGLGLVYLHLTFFIFFAAVFIGLVKINPPISTLMINRAVTEGHDIKPVQFVELEDIPVRFRKMVIWLEDSHFYNHAGIDIAAIREAAELNRSTGKIYSGASTIPQQLIKTMFLYPKRSYFRKYMEAILSVEMSLIVPKDRVLELYLNYIEWGSGIYGLEAASLNYYRCPFSWLDLDPQMRLAAVIASPVLYSPFTLENKSKLKWRYEYLCGRFSTISDDEAETEDYSAPEDLPLFLIEDDDEIASATDEDFPEDSAQAEESDRRRRGNAGEAPMLPPEPSIEEQLQSISNEQEGLSESEAVLDISERLTNSATEAQESLPPGIQ